MAAFILASIVKTYMEYLCFPLKKTEIEQKLCSAVTAVLTQTCTLQYQYGIQCYKFYWAVRLQLGVSDGAKLK